jgi:hypothetical protein
MTVTVVGKMGAKCRTMSEPAASFFQRKAESEGAADALVTRDRQGTITVQVDFVEVPMSRW